MEEEEEDPLLVSRFTLELSFVEEEELEEEEEEEIAKESRESRGVVV